MAKKIGFFIVLVLSLGAVIPFLTKGFFPMHDDTQVVRVSQMAMALSDGHFPVRWVKDLGYGYGYPIFNFYAPLPYYAGGFLSLLGFDALLATKIMMVVGILLSGIFMYLFAREFWGNLGGIVSALFYMYAPYHAVDIYVRGAVGEFWAYAFLPLLAYGLYQCSKPGIILGGLGFAGVILSHNLTAMMLLPFLVIVLLLHFYTAYKKRQLYAIRYTLYAILLGLGLSAFYWLPALVELGYTNVQSQIGGGADFRNHFACWQQLWDSHWGFGGSTAGCSLDGLSLKIGKLHVIASLVALAGAFYVWKKDKLRSSIVLVASGQLLVAILLTLEVSKPIWEVVSPLAYLQYPWRFLLFISFFSSFLTGAVVWFLGKSFRVSFVSSAILLALLLYGNGKLFEPHFIEAKSTSDFTRKENITWTTSKTTDEYMPKNFKKPMDEVDTVKQRVQIGEIKVDKTQELVFETSEKETKQILISIAPFPAWQAFIDNTSAPYTMRPNGIELTVPQGPHTIKLSYVSTRIEKLGTVVSVISILILLGGILRGTGLMTRFLLKGYEKS